MENNWNYKKNGKILKISELNLTQLKSIKNRLDKKIDNIYNNLKLNNKTIDNLSLSDQITLLRGLEIVKELRSLIKIKENAEGTIIL